MNKMTVAPAPPSLVPIKVLSGRSTPTARSFRFAGISDQVLNCSSNGRAASIVSQFERGAMDATRRDRTAFVPTNSVQVVEFGQWNERYCQLNALATVLVVKIREFRRTPVG